jgi:5-formyltetrahydrofolate cyclo-ligase
MDRPKSEWRRALIDVRRRLTAEQRYDAGTRLLDKLEPLLENKQCVAAYRSIPPEPDTAPLLDRLAATGVRTLLPVLHDDNDLGWGDDARLVRRRLGLFEPAEDLGAEEIGTAELVIVPALAVDRHGTRLGRGGGSYDRALARVRAPVVALLYDGELVDELPRDRHDRPVDFAATPQRLVSLASTA